jgi:adenosine deaminase
LLNIYPSYAEHPLKRLVQSGCTITINTDDPVLFQTSLTEEYIHAVQDCGLSLEELDNIALNAVRTSYLETSAKNTLLGDFQAESGRLRESFGIKGTDLKSVP